MQIPGIHACGCLQELHDASRSLHTLTAERDGLLQQSRAEVGRYVEEITIRKQHQEALAKALARREAEIATMRVQVCVRGLAVLWWGNIL